MFTPVHHSLMPATIDSLMKIITVTSMCTQTLFVHNDFAHMSTLYNYYIVYVDMLHCIYSPDNNMLSVTYTF